MEEKFQIKPCGKYESFFRIIDEFWLTPHQRRVAHRICTVMRKFGAESIVVEGITASSEEATRMKVEQEAIKRRLGAGTTFKVYKLTFLDETLNPQITEVELHAASERGCVLGYVVVVNVISEKGPIRNYVFESVIRELGCRLSVGERNSWQPLNGHYLHVKRKFKCWLVGKDFPLEGSFFAQQNGITSVCAHACLVMMLNNVTKTGEIVSSEDINKFLGINHSTTKFRVDLPGAGADNNNASHVGLTAQDVKDVVEKYGYEFHLRDFQGLKRPKFREFIYGFIESSFPALLSFRTGTNAHVVAAAGHTLNSNSWLPLASKTYSQTNDQRALLQPSQKSYLSSLAWVDDFLVHDDNVGMQLSFPAHAFHDVDHYAEDITFTPSYAVGIFPKAYNVQILAHQAERCAAEYLAHLAARIDHPIHARNYYLEHLLTHFAQRRQTVVLRTSLVSREDYMQHLRLGDNHENLLKNHTIELVEEHLLSGQLFWLVEVSEPDLYVGNKAKVMDVLIDPSFIPPSGSEERPTAAWYMCIRALKFPELFLARKAQTSQFDTIELETKVHCTLYGLCFNENPAAIW